MDTETRQKRIDLLAEYVRDIRNEMRLQVWDIRVREGEITGADVNASVEPEDELWYARLTVTANFWKEDQVEQRETIVHELVHLAHRGVTDSIRLLRGQTCFSEDVWDRVWTPFRRELELMTDHLSRIIAEQMPLPPEFPAD